MVDIIRNEPLTLKEAARWMKVSTKTIREWRDEGLEMVRVGRKLLYTTRENLQRFCKPQLPESYQPKMTDLEQSHREATRLLEQELGIKAT